MQYFPFFFDLKNQYVLIVGGGSIATRKARLLAKSSARLKVVAPSVSEELRGLITESNGECFLRPYDATDIDGCRLVVAATDIRSLNEQVSRDAKAVGLPVNVVDNPDLCTIIFPAIVDRDPLTIAITSSGQAPVLARMVRAKIERLIPESYGLLAQFASNLRERIKQKLTDNTVRMRFWENLLDSSVAEMAMKGQQDEATQAALALLDGTESDKKQGEVYLVGGGPGDPGLLTLRALQLMQQADVVLYDRLVSEPVLNLVRRDADRIYVGKRRSEHAVPQPEINQLLVGLAQQGKRVLRLKGGDPFIFGRGGEEIELLAQNHIPFQVVPGITAASGCAAYAGIPLTHRDYSQSVRFITGHSKADSTNLNWPELAMPDQTLVFYMGLAGLHEICQNLIRNGRLPDTPAALVEKGTTPNQRVLISTLAELPGKVVEEGASAPTLLIIGEVVKLHSMLSWYKG